MHIELQHYADNAAYDELLDATGKPRPAAKVLFRHINGLEAGELEGRRKAVEAAIMTMGITFTVYSDAGNIDRAWPFDIIPRPIA
jgi:uncharacterized circularly permuted ATP-grasp superfamily protein